jgi:hypothetical protein
MHSTGTEHSVELLEGWVGIVELTDRITRQVSQRMVGSDRYQSYHLIGRREA